MKERSTEELAKKKYDNSSVGEVVEIQDSQTWITE